MNKYKHTLAGLRTLGTAGAAALLAACATTSPESASALDQARTAVNRLEAEPQAAQMAGKPLQDARDALAKAEAAEQQHKPTAEVVHLAYLARRNADIGEAVLAEQSADAQMAQAQADRERILADARAREAARARQQALQAQQAAQASQQQAQTAEQQAQAAQEQARELQQQMADLQAKQTDRGMVLTLGNVLFDTNGDTLKPGADEMIGRLAQFMQSHPDTRVRIEGYTDSTGSDSYNQALSQRRAAAVELALENQGVSAQRLEAVGRGKAAPVASNDSPAGRQQNRRVEIIFSDPHGQFAASNG
jgi:outer membrane protein OmpA-like peptidoglycan-associated protein